MRVLDSNKQEVKAGDTITFSYGIPGRSVTAPVVNIDGRLIAITTGHKPSQINLRKLKSFVGEYYKLNEQGTYQIF